eukprot:TRINITY_DN12670_c0_g1_i1.p1 TRINITY_DN12670_c0_g1~~TRINITY_DN12670_c0_g1_i1.p1  ORF type:complete len:296 (-),score=68.35 TRINITY_DN12670_c0_g1_i1:118-1005(-)
MSVTESDPAISRRRVRFSKKWGRICCVSSVEMENRSIKSAGSSRSNSSKRDNVSINQSVPRQDSAFSGRSFNKRHHENENGESMIAFLKSALFTRRRLQVDPPGKLFFMYEPGKQTTSVVRLKNITSSFVAFKFQTNAPKSCFMRPPNGILAPKETLLTSVVKFVEPPEQNQNKNSSVPPSTSDKFKILSLKVEEGGEYTPELFEERKDAARAEGLLHVVFLDPNRPSKGLEKLKQRIAEAEAIKQARKKPETDDSAKQTPVAGPHPPVGGILEEWREQREKYLAKQQGEGADSF